MAYGPVCVVLLGSLAFLLACTPARNSDLWLHLASGRWLPTGTDPFSSTTQGVYWINHTWLSDMLLYQIYRLDNGTGMALVIVKAVLVAIVAILLTCFRRRGEGVGVPAFAGLAAILALGPWLLLQPVLLSLLGVVLTLYLLERPNLVEGGAAQKARTQRWLLVPLFALWANLDAWFVLGPILVCLYALGEPLRRFSASGERQPPARPLFILFVAGLAACLANPYHYHIFAWPTPLGLTHVEQALRHDPLGQTLVLSPFAARFANLPLFRSPGAWAYYLLLAASFASFVLSIRTLHPGRLLVWLALAALSIYQARAIPFFVVAAAPLLALNIQESSGRLAEPVQYITQRLSVLIGIVLLLLAWPGWLQPVPYQPRGWTVEPDGSLVRMAAQLKCRHEAGSFRPDRFALTFTPEAANYLAWFCPEEKGFVDSRWPLFDGVAEDYVRMRRCLLLDSGDAGQALASLMDAHQLDRILLFDSDRERMTRAYRNLFLAPEWELLSVEGGAALFRRRGTGTTPSPEAFDYRRAAYDPAPQRRAPAASPTPLPPSWFDVFRPRSGHDTADREEAALHLRSGELQTERFTVPWLLAQMTGLIGCGWGTGPAATATALAVRFQFTPPSPPSEPEPLLLAVRAARRALAVDPEDARAFLCLGEAYFQLNRTTREPSWQALLPELAVLRQAQILTALEQAVLLRPDLDPAHALLAQLYVESGQWDRCLEHLHARLRMAEQARQPERTNALRADVEKLENLVKQSEKTYQANLTGKTDPSKVLDRAQLAARFGLTRKALEMMQESSPVIFGAAGVQYQLDLMMQAGQCYEVLDVLKSGPEFQWIKACAAASCGDYAEADTLLDKDSERFRRIANVPMPVRSVIAFHVAGAVLTRPLSVVYFQPPALRVLGLATDLLCQQANRRVLRGLLALEAGEVEAAGQHFRAALDTWKSDAAEAEGAGVDFSARPIAQYMLRRMQP